MTAAGMETAPTVTPVIALDQVSFFYENRPVLENIDLAVHDGEFISLIGPNGGGKTTLLKLILGLLPPARGQVRLFGQAPATTRRLVGYVPQFMHYDPQFPVTVLDVVLMGRLGARWGGGYTRADRAAAQQALDELKILPLANRLLSQLSGGQRQRVMIARALAGSPRLLLLDEPTSNVDTEGENNLSQILQTLNQRMTILLVSHDISFVSDLVQRVLCVNHRLTLHQPGELSSTAIQDLYHTHLRMVKHSPACFEEGHHHD
jgi:zinc transport system ATP-binding protein